MLPLPSTVELAVKGGRRVPNNWRWHAGRWRAGRWWIEPAIEAEAVPPAGRVKDPAPIRFQVRSLGMSPLATQSATFGTEA